MPCPVLVGRTGNEGDDDASPERYVEREDALAGVRARSRSPIAGALVGCAAAASGQLAGTVSYSRSEPFPVESRIVTTVVEPS